MSKPLDLNWQPHPGLGLSLVRPTEIASAMRKIIIPGEVRVQTRETLIDEFLKKWLTEKQLKGTGAWYTEMLDTFMTEVLLSAQKFGIEKLLLQRPAKNIEGMFKELRNRQDIASRFPLALVSKPLKPKVAKVILEEVPGDLASETKSVLLSDVKAEKIDTSLMDIVDHVR